jgi:hypothetical protein
MVTLVPELLDEANRLRLDDEHLVIRSNLLLGLITALDQLYRGGAEVRETPLDGIQRIAKELWRDERPQAKVAVRLLEAAAWRLETP